MQYPYFTLDSLTELIQRILGIRNSVRINEASINSIMNRLSLLSRRLEIVENTADIKFVDDTTVDNAYINTDKNLIVSDLTMTSLVDSSWALIGSSVNVANSTANSVSIATTAIDGNVTIDGLTTTGSITQSVSNAALIVSTNNDVVITNGNIGQSGYNSIEIGLVNSAPKSILIKDCDFTGNMSNNAISIYATADNAIITIENCHFSSVSNVLRLSNRTNANNVTVNFVNCSWDHLDSDTAWKGVVICQDYTSVSKAEVIEANRFGNNKIAISFTDCVGENNTPVTLAEDGSSYVTGDNCLVYVYCNKWDNETAGKVPYTDMPEMFPIVAVSTTTN